MKIAVIGAGVAGSATALSLAQTGHEVVVYEAYADPAGSVGSFVSLAVNGLRGLDALGCGARVRHAGFEVPTQRMWTSGGRLIGEVARSRRKADTMMSITLKRADLVAQLRGAATEAGAHMVLGDRIEDLDGIDADLIVGADGLWSRTRSLLDPTAPTPEYAGLWSVGGIAPGLGGDVAFNMTSGRNGAFIHIPTPSGDVWWSAQVSEAQQPDRSGTGWLERVAELYRAEAEPSRIIAATDVPSSVTVMSMLAPVPIWHDARTVLIGDAIHPVGAGQGASMAIEDAVVLGQALQAEPSIAAALDAFVVRRAPRVKELLKTADDNRRFKKAGTLKRVTQEFMMGFFFERFYPRFTDWLYEYDPAAPVGLT
jgi:salicylate hydroxylase